MLNPKLGEPNLRKTLHYGAQVSLSLADDTISKGYIYGDGFITKSIAYKKEAAFVTEDFTGSIFKILQPFSSTAQKQLEEEMLIQLDGGKLRPISNISMVLEQGALGINEMQEFIDEADFEMKQNHDQFQKMKKQPVLFGESIQLFHIKSHKFLSFQLSDRDASATSLDQYRYTAFHSTLY